MTIYRVTTLDGVEIFFAESQWDEAFARWKEDDADTLEVIPDEDLEGWARIVVNPPGYHPEAK